MAETPSARRRRGREDYDGGDWKDSCPYKDNNKRQDYLDGWHGEANNRAVQAEETESDRDEFDRLSESCPDRQPTKGWSHGTFNTLYKCVYKDVMCLKENCTHWYWRGL